MYRYVNYIIAFLFSVVIFLLFRSSRIVDSLIMALFILCTIMFVFTAEEKPKDDKVMKIPQVHYYQKERQNIYGYLMICGAASTAFMFYIASTRNIRMGFLSLCLWLFLIILASFASVYANKRFHKDAIEDYLINNINYNFSDINFDSLIDALFKTRSLQYEDLKKALNKFKIEDSIKEQVIEKYIYYVSSNLAIEDELTSDEIEEINNRI
jgi:hypothetical protein